MKIDIFANLAQTGLGLTAALFIAAGLAACNKEKNASETKLKPEPESVITMTTKKNVNETIYLKFDKDASPIVEERKNSRKRL